MSDMDPHVFALDIFIAEVADLADPQAGRIHDRDHGLYFDVRQGRDESLHFFLGRDKREIGIKLAHGDLCRIPRFVKDVKGKETDLGDRDINGPVCKATLLLERIEKPDDVGIPDLGRIFMERVKNKIQIGDIYGRPKNKTIS